MDIYVYDVSTGIFMWELSGHISSIMIDIDNRKDFTLTKPPNYYQPWYWIDDKWQSEPLDTAP